MTASIMRTRFLKGFFAAALCAAALGSCASGPLVVREGLSPAELTQSAQDAYDRGRYGDAQVYYETILTRFPNDLPAVCGAEYEIAFINYKQKNYDEAKAGFRALLERYKSADAALLPAQYKVLGEKILAKIELENK